FVASKRFKVSMLNDKSRRSSSRALNILQKIVAHGLNDMALHMLHIVDVVLVWQLPWMERIVHANMTSWY
ncbi:unnamed protein product, partial [Sphagnum balticum]